jgi:predicted ATP-grasp superfamily ATP-dependent carboligase
MTAVTTTHADLKGEEAVVDHGAIVMGTNVNGIGVLRSLGRLGITCGAVFATEYGDHAYQSKYLSRSCQIARNPTDAEIADALSNLSKSMDKPRPVLIPTADRYSQFLCRNASSLSDEFRLNCADIDLYDTFLDKWRTAGICNRNRVPIPDTFCPTSDTELERLCPELEYPVIVKPRYTFDQKFPGKNAVFNDPSELQLFFRQYPVLGDVVIQKIIPSGDGDIFVIATYSSSHGIVRAMYSGRKIRQYLPDYGATCFGVSETQEDLELLTRRFLDAIHYKGFAMVEFARNRANGHPYFLELNTRTAWTNQLFADAGIDLTQIGYLEMAGLEFSSILGEIKQRDGIYWLDFRRDFASYRLKRHQGQITFLQWLRSIVKARSFAYLALADPKPFVVGCLWRIREIIQKHLFGRQ